ncbi:MAG: hypothetical protein NXI24_04100 [bacterium]|nr:hypothetical protein [bacterium]
MAKSRSKAASSSGRRKSASKGASKGVSKNASKKKASRAGRSTRSAARTDLSDAASRPPLKAGDVPDDIELLNVHRYPESMPASVVAFVRNDRSCQRRLEELAKSTPGKRGQSGFNQLFQQKLDESADGPGPAPKVYRADDSPAGKDGASDGAPDGGGPSNFSRPMPAPRRPESGGIGGFFRKLFS